MHTAIFAFYPNADCCGEISPFARKNITLCMIDDPQLHTHDQSAFDEAEGTVSHLDHWGCRGAEGVGGREKNPAEGPHLRRRIPDERSASCVIEEGVPHEVPHGHEKQDKGADPLRKPAVAPCSAVKNVLPLHQITCTGGTRSLMWMHRCPEPGYDSIHRRRHALPNVYQACSGPMT